MKFTKIFTITTLLLLSSLAIAEESYTTDCNYLIEGDRKSYKGSTATAENIKTVQLTDVTPEACVSSALTAVKQKYPAKYLAGGRLWDTVYYNVTAEIEIIHKDNVDFPKQKLETTIKKDQCVILKNSFEFESAYFGDDYYEGKVAFNSVCKK